MYFLFNIYEICKYAPRAFQPEIATQPTALCNFSNTDGPTSVATFSNVSIKTGTFGQAEFVDPKLMQLNFDPGVENRIIV